MKILFLKLFLSFQLVCAVASAQNVAINATGGLPHPNAILDISSTTSGLLIPRMSAAERNAIAAPPAGLQVYNTTTNTLDVFRNAQWEQSGFADSAVILVRSLADLPPPAGNEIKLDSTKTYTFSGLVNLSTNYINLNGAAVRGNNPVRDGVMSSVGGAILRSTNMHVYMEKMLIVPLAPATKAFELSDATGLRSCNILTGINIKDGGPVSEGVGQVSGFRAVIILQNYWNTSKGIKVGGRMGRFICGFTLIGGITGGAAIEFLPALVIDDIDLANNHFVYNGASGVKVSAGAVIDKGRMTTNMFHGVTTLLDGFDSYTPAWEMQQNSDIPNSRAFAFSYMNDNTSSTQLTSQGVYYKVNGATTAINTKRFTHANNRLTYTGKRKIVGRIFVVVGGKAPENSSDFSIAIAKNGTIIPFPNSTMGSMTNNQGYQIALETEVDLVSGDYVEVFI